MQTTKYVAILVSVCSMIAVGRHASADDAEDEAEIRGDLYLKLPSLADGERIRSAFDKAFSGDASAATELMAFLRHSDIDVARDSAHILGRFPSAAAAAALKEVFAQDSRGVVRVGALTGLKRMAEPATASLAVSALSDSDGFVQLGGIGVLELLGDSHASAAILSYVDSAGRLIPPDVVFETLGKLGDTPGSTAVRDRLVSEANNKANEWEIRLAAAEGLRTMGMADLVRRVLDREDAGMTNRRMMVLEGKIRKLASAKQIVLKGQDQVDALLAEAKTSDPKGKEDYWGRPLRARFVPKDTFCVVSDGPDKTMNTADDMSTAEPYATYDLRTFADLFPPR